MYKEDLTLNNLQWLMCHEIKSNQTKSNWIKVKQMLDLE